MIELGGDFNLSINELEETDDNLVTYLKDYNVQWFDFGRTAIKHIPIGNGKVLLPEFICKSVIDCFKENTIVFYKIDENLRIDFDDLLNRIDSSVEIIYITHYFGYIQDLNSLLMIREIANRDGIKIVEDTTQSIFSEHNIIGDYVIASIRKWMPIPQGGILYTAKDAILPSDSNYPKSKNNDKLFGMVLKELYIKDLYDTNEIYRDIFLSCEKCVDDMIVGCKISDLTFWMIGCNNVNDIIIKRKRNAKIIEGGLEDMGIHGVNKFSDTECPLVYPIRVKNRDQFRQYLIENRIYCAVHWLFDGYRPAERNNSIINGETLISLPIDQRYSDKEMKYMLDVISMYKGELLC